MRFAYLIMAHGNFELLKEIIKALDCPENDIYIHLDSKCGVIDKTLYEKTLEYSKVFFIEKRISGEWGRVSMLKIVFNLLEKSLQGKYDYYHLISGQDFPIKGNQYILNFFEKNNGKEFIHISSFFDEHEIMYRVGYRHLINGNLVNKYKFWGYFNKILVHSQRLLHIRYVSSVKGFRGGAAWFSITHNFAMELFNNREEMLNLYKYTCIPDEIYLQTFVSQHHYEYKLYKEEDTFSNCRLIVFKNHNKNPYVWKAQDFDELMKSSCLWARKFSEKDMNLIHRIAKCISNNN